MNEIDDDNELIIRFESANSFFGDEVVGSYNSIIVNGEKIVSNGSTLESILNHLGCTDIGNLDMEYDDLHDVFTYLGYAVDISYN